MFEKIFFENVIQPCRSVENQANSDLRLLSLNESRELIENQWRIFYLLWKRKRNEETEKAKGDTKS